MEWEIFGPLIGIGLFWIADRVASWNYLASLKGKLEKNKIKTDVLWDVYGITAMKKGAQAGLISSSSAIILESKWHENVPQEVTDRLVAQSKENLPEEIWQSENEDLMDIADQTELTPEEIFGVLKAMCDKGVNNG